MSKHANGIKAASEAAAGHAVDLAQSLMRQHEDLKAAMTETADATAGIRRALQAQIQELSDVAEKVTHDAQVIGTVFRSEAVALSDALYAPPATLFSLAVDNTRAVPVFDETGRHHVAILPSSASVSPSTETAPDGSRALRFDGGWLEVTNAMPESAADFELAADR